MTDTSSPTPLTDQALARLRKLADGNGLNPEKIELFGTEEQTYTMRGTLTLIPKCTVETGRYPGPARGGKRREVFPNLEAMHAEVQRRKNQFQSGRGWIDASLRELKAATGAKGGEGWGLEGAQVVLPEQSTVLTASTGCPTCRGQKLITCQQCHGQGTFTCSFCHGQRQTTCYACGGTGHNPQNPQQPCSVCNGRRFSLCRHCNGSGQMTCPNCHGRRGTPCPMCKGSGQMSEEIALECGAETHFKLDSQGLPSGLRNGLGRLGIPNLAKGHAAISVLPPKTDDPDPEADDDKKIITSHSIDYEAQLPYADLRMNFGGKKALVSVFGKRAILLGVPPFLDDALKPAREKLALAATGAGALDDALPARAIHEALQLELGGKGSVQEFRRLYSVGLSQEVMQEILKNLRLSLKRHTLKIRIITAAICGTISAAFFAGIFLTDSHTSLTQNWALGAQAAFDLALLALPMGLGWFALNLATRAALQRRFHNHTIALQQTTSKTAYVMFAAIIVMYGAVLMLAQVKPGWMAQFF